VHEIGGSPWLRPDVTMVGPSQTSDESAGSQPGPPHGALSHSNRVTVPFAARFDSPDDLRVDPLQPGYPPAREVEADDLRAYRN
jgi:hypothetical protein